MKLIIGIILSAAGLLLICSFNFDFIRAGIQTVVPNVNIVGATSTIQNSQIVLFSRSVINGTEYALGVKDSDLLVKPKYNYLQNQTPTLTAELRPVLENILDNLSQGNTKNLLVSTDEKVVTETGEELLALKYNKLQDYFKDYRSVKFEDGFATILSDKSIILLESFINSSGEIKMFSIALSKSSTGYKIFEIFAGESSIVVSLEPSGQIIVPNPSPGFERKDLAEVNANILIPSGWYFRHVVDQGTQAYFVSKEEINDKNKMFETGLTINFFSSNMIPGGDATRYMDVYIKEISTKGKVENQSSGKFGDFVYKDVTGVFDDGNFKFKENLRMIVNTETNSLYLIIFESTLEKWDSEWQRRGKPMVNYMSLDSSN